MSPLAADGVRRGPAPAPRLHVESIANGYAVPLARGLEWSGFFDEVPPGAHVLLKPNLTYPEYRPGVMTSVACLDAVVALLRSRGYAVTIAEADGGGYNRFSMDAVFEAVGVHEVARAHGARVVNLTNAEPYVLEVRSGLRRLKVHVPRLLLDGIDAFISLPVPKIHMNTMVSLSIKNQWGCIQVPSERLRLHPYLADVMYEMNRRLPRPYAVIDGRYGLNRSGPMGGDPVPLDVVIVTNDLVAADRAGCRLMRVDERTVGHLTRFRDRGWWPEEGMVSFQGSVDDFAKVQFYLVRQWTDYPGVACFNNAFLAWLGYHSPFAGLAHWLLYRFRKPLYDYSAERSKLGRRDPDGSP